MAVGVKQQSDVSRVRVFLGNGDGTLQPDAIYAVDGFNAPARIDAHDVNGDWIADLIVTGAGGDQISVLLGNGDGTFDGAYADVPTGSGPIGLAVGDLNADGRLDLLTADSTHNSVSALLNATVVPKTGSVLKPLDNPQRLVAGDRFVAGETRTYDLHNLGGGVPAGVTAVSVNVTVSGTTGPATPRSTRHPAGPLELSHVGAELGSRGTVGQRDLGQGGSRRHAEGPHRRERGDGLPRRHRFTSPAASPESVGGDCCARS